MVWKFVLVIKQNPDDILEESNEFEESFRYDPLTQSTVTQHTHVFMSPTIKRDIACFPASASSSAIPTPRIHSPTPR